MWCVTRRRAAGRARAGRTFRKLVGTFYVVRHAKAGSRSNWPEDDRFRPLGNKGSKQAEALVSILEPFPITAVYSSPFLRCVQTVAPLALAPKLARNQNAQPAERP